MQHTTNFATAPAGRKTINPANPFARRLPRIVCALALAAICCAAPEARAYSSATPPTSGPTVPGDRAMLRGDIACAPANAPEAVKRAIWATNFIVRKPYVWGGGHGTFYDRGYDCSGSVSFLLHHAGVLQSPAASGELQAHGQSGRGRWITVYARNGHTFANVAGLRLDTTGASGDEGPRWRRDGRAPSGFAARHPAGM